MARTFYILSREPLPDEAPIDIVVEYVVASWGCSAQTYGPAENCYPGEPIEIDIVAAWGDFGPVVLRDDEVEQVETWVAENSFDHGDDDYYDDWER